MRGPTIGERVHRLAVELLFTDSLYDLMSLWNLYGRMVMFDYELLNKFSESEIAVSVLWTSIAVYEERFKRRVRFEGLYERLYELSGVEPKNIAKCIGAV